MANKLTPEDIALAAQYNEELQAMLDASKGYTKELQNQVAELGNAELRTQAKLRLLREELVEMKKQGDIESDRYSQLMQLISHKERQLALERQISDEAERQQAQIENRIKNVVKLVGYSTQLGDSMKQFGKSAKKALDTRGVKGFASHVAKIGINFGKAALEVFSITNILGALIKSTIEFALMQDRAEASFVRATGAGREYGQVINAVAGDLYSFGINNEQVAATMGTLYAGITNFHVASDTAQESLGKTASQLEAVGASGHDVTEIIQQLSLGFGMTHEQAMAVTKDIEQFGASIGATSGQIVSDFNKSMKVLAVFGKNADKMFKQTAKLARGLGMEASELLQTMSKFDEFDTAAGAVAGLNAALGPTSLNTMDLVMAQGDVVAQMKMLKGAFDESGKSFDQMNVPMQRYIASQLGMSITETNQLFGKSIEEIKALSKEKEDLAERAKDAADVMTQLALVMGTIVNKIVPAVVKAFGFGTGSITDFADRINKWLESDAGKQFIGKIVSLVEGLAWVMGKLIDHWKTFASVWVGIKALQIVALLKSIGLSFSLAAAPIAPLILAIGSLLAVMYVFRDELAAMWGTIFNTIFSTLNMVIRTANLIPGIEIPLIPKFEAGWEGFADGVTNFGGGMALVGEQGPELVTMGKGANVITNENTNRIASAVASGGGTSGNQALIAALDRNTAAVQSGGSGTSSARAAGRESVPNIVLHMNDREFARVVDDRVDKVIRKRS